MYVHINAQTLNDGAGVARVEDIGPVILSQAMRWLSHRQVNLRPVIDLLNMPAYDCYETPPRLKEGLWLAKPADFFPHSPTLTRNADDEHVDPYLAMNKGGPPGQTALDLMGRLGRKPHRIKTHGRWNVTQPRPGLWIWRAPHGLYYLVDDHGTTPLGTLWQG